jgi:uncharacterized membrane protein
MIDLTTMWLSPTGMVDAGTAGMYSKAKIFGHPIHPMLVGFPVAFYTSTVAAYVAYAATGELFWFHLGVVANIAGVVAAAAAAVPGFIDWAVGVPTGHPAKTTGLEHMLLNVGALILFAVDACIQYRQWDEAAPLFTAAIALAAIGIGVTIAAGFLGWKMVQTHHVGVHLSAAQAHLDGLEPSPRGGRPVTHGT